MSSSCRLESGNPASESSRVTVRNGCHRFGCPRIAVRPLRLGRHHIVSYRVCLCLSICISHTASSKAESKPTTLGRLQFQFSIGHQNTAESVPSACRVTSPRRPSLLIKPILYERNSQRQRVPQCVGLLGCPRWFWTCSRGSGLRTAKKSVCAFGTGTPRCVISA